MNKQLLLLALALWGALALKAQDPVFSQFHRSSVYLNPAFTGLDGGFTATATSREQWGKVVGNAPYPGVFSTQYASVEWTGSSLKNGISAFFMNDVEGDANLRTEYGGVNYCYVLPVEKMSALHNFRLAFGFYYSKKTIEWDQLLFSDQLDPKGEDYFLPTSSHAQFYDEFRENPPWWTGLNLGFLYRYSEKRSVGQGVELSVGFNSTHVLNLLSPTTVESLQGTGAGLDARYTLHGSAFFPELRFGTKANRFTPIFHGRIEYQGGISGFTLGNDLLFKNFGLGLYYQNTFASTIWGSTDALIVAADMEVPFGKKNQSIEIGLSYDINMSGLRSYTGGVFELVLKYRLSSFSNNIICPPVSRAHRERWKNSFNRTPNNKNLN